MGQDVREVSLKLMEQLVTDEDEFITVFYGQDVKVDDAQSLTDEIGGAYKACEVEMQYGGQPLYYYLFSVE